MGIQPKGMFGGFYKKTGPLVGRRGNRKNIVTALHHWSGKPGTADQGVQRVQFTLLTKFLNGICHLVTFGFKQYAKSRTGLNAAFKFNFDHAFLSIGTGSENIEYVLNYPELVFSRGNIVAPNCPSLHKSAAFSLTFEWLPENQSLYCQSTDLATFVLYNETKGQFIIRQDGVPRAALTFAVEVPLAYTGDKVYGYMSFTDATEKFTGNSICAGWLTV